MSLRAGAKSSRPPVVRSQAAPPPLRPGRWPWGTPRWRGHPSSRRCGACSPPASGAPPPSCPRPPPPPNFPPLLCRSCPHRNCRLLPPQLRIICPDQSGGVAPWNPPVPAPPGPKSLVWGHPPGSGLWGRRGGVPAAGIAAARLGAQLRATPTAAAHGLYVDALVAAAHRCPRLPHHHLSPGPLHHSVACLVTCHTAVSMFRFPPPETPFPRPGHFTSSGISGSNPFPPVRFSIHGSRREEDGRGEGGGRCPRGRRGRAGRVAARPRPLQLRPGAPPPPPPQDFRATSKQPPATDATLFVEGICREGNQIFFQLLRNPT